MEYYHYYAIYRMLLFLMPLGNPSRSRHCSTSTNSKMAQDSRQTDLHNGS